MTDLAGGADDNDGLSTEDAEFLAGLVADSREEGREAVIILLPQRLIRVMMTLGTLEADTQEELRGRLCQILRIAGDAEIIGRSVAIGRTFRGDQLADKAIERFVLAERRCQPIVQRPHTLFADGGAVGADQVGPLQG